jgi:exosortase
MPSTIDSFRSKLPAARTGLFIALSALVLWAYWPTLVTMSGKWLHDPQYSHGYLVPAFAVALLWLRRSQMPTGQATGSWWGLALILTGVLMRLVAIYIYFDWLDAASLLPCLAGLFLLIGGGGALRWSWPAIAFLLFMIPLPHRVETTLSHPLQRLATQGSTYVMQTLGLPAVSEGNTILLDRGRIGVVEACSGLSMLLLFFALATALVMVIKRPALDKAVILLSAVPIAVIVNVLRISVTGMATEWANPEVAQTLFHDWAGWLMMPVALGLLWGEIKLLGWFLVAPSQGATPAVNVPAPPGAARLAPQSKKPRKEQRPPAPVSRPTRNR